MRADFLQSAVRAGEMLRLGVVELAVDASRGVDTRRLAA
jgi:hypothetical protein